MSDAVKTICPYCGVGCGIIANQTNGTWTISGDKSHPANYGRLCSKGASLGETIDLNGRVLHPLIDNQVADWPNAISHTAEKFKRAIEKHGADSVAFYVSGQLLTEDYYVANKLMKGFIGSANIDTNSRLCMSSTVAGYKRAFGSDTVPCSYEDLERSKLIVLVGSNTAWCHPVLFQRISQAKKDNADLSVIVIDPRKTTTCDVADLHLPVNPGTDAMLFNGLLNYLSAEGETNPLYVENYTEGSEDALQYAKETAGNINQVAEYCGLNLSDLQEFYRQFARTERVVTVFSQGVNQSSSGTDKVNAIINCHLLTGRIGRPGMGPFSFTGQTNAMGGREVGGLANTLTAHFEFEPDDISTVQKFWQSPVIATKPGLKAVDLFKATHDGKIKALWIMCTNPVVSLPDANFVKAALERCEFVVVSECVENTDTTKHANVILPALPWAEKDGTVTNSERRISRQHAFLPAAGEARPDWWIIAEIAKAMGYEDSFQYDNAREIFVEYAKLSGYKNVQARDFDISALGSLSSAEYDALEPVQWPVNQNSPKGTARMFGDGRFYTASGKAQFVAINPSLPINKLSETYPFALNTGRVRDQWHTMTRTGKAPRLADHSPEPYAEMHPSDIKRIGAPENGLVCVESQWGKMIVRLMPSKNQKPGNVFIPMHWNGQFAKNGRVDALVNPVTDPVSGQPEFKHTPVNVTSYTPVWHGFMLSRREILMDEEDTSYWIKARGKGFCRYELAGEQVAADWPAWARKYLCSSANDVNWVEYLDESAGNYRGVRLINDCLESCIFIGPTHALPARNWLASLFDKTTLTDDERAGLLAGKPLSGQKDHGKIVCACFAVGENTLIEGIKSGDVTSVESIGAKLKAGTNCGSCVPELKAILQSLGK